MKLSIIVPCYNVQSYISECIESLLKQTLHWENIQLIFVDDCSTDQTLHILYDYEKRYEERMLVIALSENIRQGGARNVGMQYATGDYIGFVDADDWVEEDMYQMLYNKALETGYDIIHCGSYRNFENGVEEVFNVTDVEGAILQEFAAIEGGKRLTVGTGGVWSNIYRKDFLLKNNIWFPEKLKFEDNYFGAKVSLYAKSIYSCKACKYHYRENPESTLRKRNDFSIFDRLVIEEMKLAMYEKLGVFQRFYEEIEQEFIQMYYLNTLMLMANRFDKPPYDIFLKMQSVVKSRFENYRESSWTKNLEKEELKSILLRTVDMPLTQIQFETILNHLKMKNK